uniref:Exocyst complex component n=1 Tax=Aplanochytrium stocchinoi TaxID=215587 RepID=A0A7S3V0F1_9STRA|mmetsp:Transcript_29559/g.36534  ORF Transcript_29559/g.36534 Transcript_29559/m.36534 type:complete len:245 (+) Transcript_29559:74-808(+)
MENLCEWIGQVAKKTETSDLLKLVADSTYCRTELLNRLWERLVSLELRRSKRDMEMDYECKSINRQFVRLENALLAQYVKQQALPLKDHITANFQPNCYTLEPVGNLRVRPYVLELLLGLAASLENCRGCGLVGSRILYGLYNQLVMHMYHCISETQTPFSVSEARQLEIDIDFIGTTLNEYETDETKNSLAAALSKLKINTSKEVKESDARALENWEEIKTNALNDAFNRSSLLLQCFTNKIN